MASIFDRIRQTVAGLKTKAQQGIQNWAQANPQQAQRIISYQPTKPIAQTAYNVGRNIVTQTLPAAAKTITGYGKQFGTGLGGAITAPFEARRLQSMSNVDRDIANQNMMTAIKIQKTNPYMVQRLFERNRQLLNQAQQRSSALTQKLQKGRQDVISGAIKTGMTVLGANYAFKNPAMMTVGAGLYGLTGKLQGKNPYVEAGRGMAESVKTAGLTQFTNPVISGLIGKSKSFVNNPLAKQFIARALGGLGNVTEDEFLARLDQRDPTSMDRINSFGLGAIFASGGKMEDWDSLKSNTKNLIVNGGRKLNLDVRPHGDVWVTNKDQPDYKYRNMPEFLYQSLNKVKKGDYPMGLSVKPKGGTGAILKAEQLKGVKTMPQGSTPLPKNIQKQIQQSLSNDSNIFPVSAKSNKTVKSAVEQGLKTPQALGGTSLKSVPQDEKAFNVNLKNLDLAPQEKATLKKTIDIATPELQKFKGKTLSNDEVLKAAKSSEILQKITPREVTLQAEAAMLKARQQMTSLDKEVTELTKSGNTEKLRTKLSELVDSLKVVSSNAADKGRQLQALSIKAGDESVRQQVLKDILKIEADSNKVIEAAMKVNWDNANEVGKFYRSFVKPSVGQIIDEFRYNNMLSNPRTHIRNAFSNMVQTFITRPATIAIQGDIKGAGQYYSGALRSFPTAIDAFLKSFKGEAAMTKPDLEYTPSYKLPGLLTAPTRAMEAADKFFSALIRGGELAKGSTIEEAEKVAEYSLFRQGLNPQGQGKLLNAIDGLTNWMYKAPKAVRWFAPFIKTPMNFAKQWIEYSPLGIATLPGSADKKAQIGKAMLGSIVTAIGAKFALDGRTTWSAPTDSKQKEQFYATGRKPFSVKIGNKWVSMQYLGPFGLAMALPAAIKYNSDQSRTAPTDNQLEKITKSVMAMAEYFSGQTFLEGINNFVKLASGDVDYSLPKNLAYSAGQVIPLEGLVRYISTVVDPIYRRPKGFVQQMQSNIPFMTQSLPHYYLPGGEPSTRERRNLVTPYDVTTNKPEYEEDYQGRTLKLQQNNAKKEAIQSFLDGDRETAKQLQQQTGFKVKSSEIKSAAKKRAIEAFLQGDRETARKLQQQYKLKITKKDLYGKQI